MDLPQTPAPACTPGGIIGNHTATDIPVNGAFGEWLQHVTWTQTLQSHYKISWGFVCCTQPPYNVTYHVPPGFPRKPQAAPEHYYKQPKKLLQGVGCSKCWGWKCRKPLLIAINDNVIVGSTGRVHNASPGFPQCGGGLTGVHASFYLSNRNFPLYHYKPYCNPPIGNPFPRGLINPLPLLQSPFRVICTIVQLKEILKPTLTD